MTKQSGQKISVKTITEIAVMAALLSVVGPLTVPIGPVPVSMAPFMIILTVTVLGAKKGAAAVGIYILLGFAGLPVFSGFSGGAQKILGPTGGFILGYIPMALTAGFFIDRFRSNMAAQISGSILALLILYTFGTALFVAQTGMDLLSALKLTVIPFAAMDIVKIILAIMLGKAILPALKKAELIS